MPESAPLSEEALAEVEAVGRRVAGLADDPIRSFLAGVGRSCIVPPEIVLALVAELRRSRQREAQWDAVNGPAVKNGMLKVGEALISQGEAIARLRGLLRKRHEQAGHRPDCPVSRARFLNSSAGCECGWAKLKADIERELAGEEAPGG